VPNWVFNNLTVSGDAIDLAVFKEEIGKPYDTGDVDWVDGERVPSQHISVFSFWNALAPSDPEKYWNPPFEKRNPDATTESILAESIRAMAEDEDWYNWNIRNWDTKWDACNAYLNEDKDGELRYDFDTAWSIPEAAMIAMSAKFPNLTFDLYSEEEQGWGAEILFKQGVATWCKEWDIPETHADYARLDRECWGCNSVDREDDGTWNTEDLYEDCPIPDFEDLEKQFQETKAYFEKNPISKFYISGLTTNPESDNVAP